MSSGSVVQDISPPNCLCTSCKSSRNSIFFLTFPWTPGLFFYGFPHIPGTSTAFLHLCGIFIQNIYPQIICVHPADALELLHFPGTFTQTPCKNAVHVLGRHIKRKKKQPWCPGKCAKKMWKFQSIPRVYTKNFVGKCPK